MLIEGARGEDIKELNMFLYNNGYIDDLKFNFMMDNMDIYTYNYLTTEAVKKYQESSGLYKTGSGNISASTWKNMGLEIYSTLEEEFWSGKKGNDTISVAISGNTITIDYAPKIFMYEDTEQYGWTFDSYGNEYYQKISCIEQVSSSVYKYYKDLIVEGFTKWSSDEKTYHIQGVYATVIVNVKPERVTDSTQANLCVSINATVRSYVPTTFNWRTDHTPKMNLFLGKQSAKPNVIDEIMRGAMHEFGHVLGLFDAYKSPPFTFSEADKSHARENDVMYNKPQQEVFSYNIEMMLYTFKNNELQNYANSAAFGVNSEVYYRTGGSLRV